MRTVLLIMVLTLTFGAEMWGWAQVNSPSVGALNHTTSVSSTATTTKLDFNTEIKPIFQARCQPCHFQGGKVYAEMPFDKPETITRLGTKLFTRIKDEKEQRLIREFLDQP